MSMRKTPEDFSKFGKHFQESMVQLMLEDRAYCDQITEVLDTSFFELAYLQVFVNKVINYRKKYKVHPTYKTMITILRTELEGENDALQSQVKDYFVDNGRYKFTADFGVILGAMWGSIWLLFYALGH